MEFDSGKAINENIQEGAVFEHWWKGWSFFWLPLHVLSKSWLFGAGMKFIEVYGKEIVQEGLNATKQEDNKWVNFIVEEFYPEGVYNIHMIITHNDNGKNVEKQRIHGELIL